MVVFHYDNSAAGVPAGFEKTLPDNLAAELTRLGVGHIRPVSEGSKAEAVKDTATGGKPSKMPRKGAKTQ